jgi:hypothetical protein
MTENFLPETPIRRPPLRFTFHFHSHDNQPDISLGQLSSRQKFDRAIESFDPGGTQYV